MKDYSLTEEQVYDYLLSREEKMGSYLSKLQVLQKKFISDALFLPIGETKTKMIKKWTSNKFNLIKIKSGKLSEEEFEIPNGIYRWVFSPKYCQNRQPKEYSGRFDSCMSEAHHVSPTNKDKQKSKAKTKVGGSKIFKVPTPRRIVAQKMIDHEETKQNLYGLGLKKSLNFEKMRLNTNIDMLSSVSGGAASYQSADQISIKQAQKTSKRKITPRQKLNEASKNTHKIAAMISNMSSQGGDKAETESQPTTKSKTSRRKKSKPITRSSLKSSQKKQPKSKARQKSKVKRKMNSEEFTKLKNAVFKNKVIKNEIDNSKFEISKGKQGVVKRHNYTQSIISFFSNSQSQVSANEIQTDANPNATQESDLKLGFCSKPLNNFFLEKVLQKKNQKQSMDKNIAENMNESQFKKMDFDRLLEEHNTASRAQSGYGNSSTVSRSRSNAP